MIAAAMDCWHCTPGAFKDMGVLDRPRCAAHWRELEAQMKWVRVMPRNCPGCGKQRFKCGSDCPMSVGIHRAWAEDDEWFRQHPEATERVRPFTVAEHLGWFLTNGSVHSELVRRVRTGIWFNDARGRPVSEMLTRYEVD